MGRRPAQLVVMGTHVRHNLVRMTSTIDAEFDAYVAPFREALRHLVAVEREVRQRRGLLPAANSEAMSETFNGHQFSGAGAWGGDLVQRAYTMVSLLLMTAEDHILAACRLFDPGPSPVFAHMSVARVPFEACLTARWMLEPGTYASVSTVEEGRARNRIARFMNYQLDDLAEKAKAMKLVDKSQRKRGPYPLGEYPEGRPRADIARDDAASILDEAQRLNFEMHLGKGDKVHCLKPHLPDTIVLAEQCMGQDEHGDPIASDVGTILWRFWSGITHSKWYALREGVERADDVGAVALAPGTVPAAFVTKSDAVLTAFTVAAIGYMPVCARFHALMGWGEAEAGRREAAEAVLAHVHGHASALQAAVV
jgi:hypothetical protein